MSPESSLATMFTRRCLLVGGIAIIVLIVTLIIWTSRRQTQADKLIQQKLAALRAAGEPVTGGDLAKIFAVPPPAEDAGILFSNALEFAILHKPPHNGNPIIDSGPLPQRTAALDDAAVRALRTFFEDTADITNVMPAVPDGVRFGNHWEHGVLNAPMVPFVKMRSLMQLLGTRALYAAEAGDIESASQMLALGFRFAQAIPAESTLVEHMIRAACMGLACSVTERCLNRASFNDRQLTRVIEAMPGPDTNGIIGTLRVESCLAISVFQEVKAGRPLDSYMSGNRSEPWWKRAWKRLRSRRSEYSDGDFIRCLDMIPELQRAGRLPVAEQIPACTRLFMNYQTNVISETGQAITPNWSRALGKHYEIEAQVAVTKLALTINRFRVAHEGRLPGSLESLVPNFIATIPHDLFDDRPLRFKPLTNGYVVYSIGADGVDDGGVERANPYAQTNCDVTVTVER